MGLLSVSVISFRRPFELVDSLVVMMLIASFRSVVAVAAVAGPSRNHFRCSFDPVVVDDLDDPAVAAAAVAGVVDGVVVMKPFPNQPVVISMMVVNQPSLDHRSNE